MAEYVAGIKVQVTGQSQLDKLEKSVNTIHGKVLELTQKRIPQIQLDINVSRVYAAMTRISGLFRRRDYRLNVNDTAIKSAIVNAQHLQRELNTLTSTKYVIDIEYRSSGTTPQSIASRARAARTQGLSGQLADILREGAASVGGLATAEKRTTLLSRISRGSLPKGGYNVEGLKEIVKALGGKVSPKARRADLEQEAQRLINTVDDAAFDAVYNRLLDMQMQFKPVRGTSAGFFSKASRSTPNFQELVDRMAFATKRPGTAQRMLRQLPESAITTDLAALASKQTSLQEAIPLSRTMYKESKYFDPLLKAIAEAFSKYVKSFNATWAGTPGQGMRNILSRASTSQSTGVRGLLPPAGATGGTAVSRAMFEGLTPLRAPRLGRAEDERYLRAIRRLIDEANEQLGIQSETTSNFRAIESASETYAEFYLRQLREARSRQVATRSRRMLPPAGGTGGSGGGGGGGGAMPMPMPFGDEPMYSVLGRPLDVASLRADRIRRVAQGRARQQRARQMTENVLIGGAFPMLFGGGPGAVLGGAAGGFIPGNPMLSVATSALGALLDQFTTSVTEMGASLQDPISNFQKLADAGLIASRSQKQYIERLIEAGRVTEAAAVIQDEIIQKIGVSGLRDLQAAGAASDKLNKAFAEFSLQAQAAVAGPLADILTWLTSVVAVGNTVNRQAAQQTDILQGLSAADRRSLQQQEQQILQGSNLFNEAQKRQQVQDLYQQYAPRAIVQRPGVSVDTTPELQAQAQTQELQAQVTLEAKKLSLVGMSLEKNGQIYVEAAKTVALQEYKNRLLEINNYWIGKAYDAEKNQLMIRQANLRLAAKIKEIDLQAARAAEKANEERIRAYQQTLQLQNQLAQTVLDEYRILEQGIDLYKGPVAIQEEIIRNEYESVKVSKDYAANQATIDATFDNRFNNLKLEEDFLKSQLVIQRERARLEQDISTAQLESQNKQRRVAGQTEIDRLQTELAFPFGGERLERDMQMLDQYTRRINELVSLQDNLAEIQKTITRAEATPGLLTEDQLNAKRAEFNVQQDQLNQLTAELQIRDQLEQQLLRQQQIYAKYGFIADEVSRALSDSIAGLVTGTTTVAEAFGRMFENIGKAFIDMATQILAQQLLMQVVSAFLPSGFGATDSRGFSFGSLVDAFADGGFVTGPTRAIIGEGGEPEYVIPASKMPGALARYASGMRGGSVIDGAVSDNRNFLDALTTGISNSTVDVSESQDAVAATRASLRETERLRENRMQIMSQQSESERRYERERIEQMASTPGNLNIKYESQVINSVEYVTRDQAERMAAQSALRGRELAIGSLQNSVKTRKRVGIA
jgi:hypothetical protein